MPQLFKFKNIDLYTDKLSELKHFYSKVLNFPLSENESNTIAIQFKFNSLTFHQSEIPAYYHFAINIPENKIEEAAKYLKDCGVKLISFDGHEIIDFPNWNAHSLYFLDPAKNIVEFIARHNIDNSSNIRFHPKNTLEISEIGLVEKDLKALGKVIEEGFYFQKFKGASNNFMPMGHEESLFICVPKKRHWFPTQIESRQFPIKITLKNGQSERIICYENEDYVIKF